MNNLSLLRLSQSVTKSIFSRRSISSSTFSRIIPKPNHRFPSFSTLSGGGDEYWRINKKSTILFGSGTMFGGSMMYFYIDIYDYRCEYLACITDIMEAGDKLLKFQVAELESRKKLDPMVLMVLEACYEVTDEFIEELQNWMFPDTTKAMASILRVKKIIKSLLSP